MQIALVNPPHRKDGAIFPSGRAYLVSSLRANGHDVQVLDLAIGAKTDEEIEGELQNLGNWDVFLIGGLITAYRTIKKIIVMAKRLHPDKPVIGGDGIISGDPQFAMTHLEVDYGVIGEGELTIIDLLAALKANDSVSRVDGICYLENGKVVFTSSRKPLQSEELDLLPLPSWDDWDMDFYLRPYAFYNRSDAREFHLVAQRGCAFNCHFCYNVFGRKSRKRSADNIVSEIMVLKDRFNVELMHMGTELYLAHKPLVRQVSEELKKRDIVMEWSANGRVDLLDDDYAAFLAETGCVAINFGFESFDNGQLTAMGKKVNLDDVYKSVSACKKAGLFIYGSLMIYLGENLKTLQKTMDVTRELDLIPFKMFVVNPYPRTELFNQIRHRIIDLEAYYSSLGDAFDMAINPTDFDSIHLMRLRDRMYQEMRRDYLTRHSTESLPFRESSRRSFISLGPEFGRSTTEIYNRILQEQSLSSKGINLTTILKQRKAFNNHISSSILEKLPADTKIVALAGNNDLTCSIVSTLEKSGLQVVAIYDNNASLHGQKICGVEIKGYSELDTDRPESVLINSLAWSFTIREQIKDAVKGGWDVKLFDLYEFLS